MSNQLVKKNPAEGYQNVFPKTFIDAIKDKESGVSLQEILQGFNMYFLSYNGSRALTRCKIPTVLRKEGLWITYVLYDHTVVTEWYNSDQIDDNSWSMDSNWRVASNNLVGDVSVSVDGYWVINGEKTEAKAQGEQGVTPLLRVGANNKLQVSYNAGKGWKDISDYIVPRFRYTRGTTNNTAGIIQISMDLGKTWTNLSNEITNNLRISRYIGINESLPTSGVAEGTVYMKGPYYDEGDTSNANSIYRMWVYAWKGNTLAWQDNGEFTSISAGVVQERGTSTTEVMSQEAVTRELTELESDINSISGSEEILEQTLSAGTYPQINISRNYKPGNDILFEVITPNDLKIVAIYEMSAEGNDVITQHSINAISGRMKISDNYQGRIRVVFIPLSSSTQVSVRITDEGALRTLETKVEILETLKPEVEILEKEVNSISGSEEVLEQILPDGIYPQINLSRNYKAGDKITVEVLTPEDLRIAYLYEISADGKNVIVQHSIDATSGTMEISENYQGRIRILFIALSAPTEVSVRITNEGALKAIKSEAEALKTELLGYEEVLEQTLQADDYPQFNISRDYNPGDTIKFEVLTPDNLVIAFLYEMSATGEDVIVQHSINKTSGVIKISENYQGRIKILFAALSSPTKVSIKITYKSKIETLQKGLEILKPKVETLESRVEILEPIILGSEEVLTQELSASSYPQINISRNYKPGDKVRIKLITPDNLIIAFLYEMSTDNKDVIVQHWVNATSGTMEISDRYQGNIRILFAAITAPTQVSVSITLDSDLKKIEDKVDTLEIDVETLENKTEALLQQSPYMNSLRIIKRVGCIGDSYTQGHIQLKGQSAELKEEYSWPFFLSQITGNTYSNWGVGGSTAKDWMNSIISVVDEPGNKCQAYIIGLGINDGSSWSSTATRPGESSDIGTDNDVYIAYYYKIVQRCLSVNPLAKILCLTMPNRGEDYNAAVRDVVSHCNENGQNNVLLVDLAQDKYAKSENFYKNPYYLSDASEGHYTAIGYEFMAECFYIILSDIIKNNISEFQNIHQIPYDEIVA